VAGSLAQERGEGVYLVGGAVRDLLLGRPVRDVDLAVEGDAAAFSRALAERLGARPTVHERFGTATLALANATRMDLASARRETYSRPGALPQVELGAAIAEDLARRDFPIHAMAIEVSPPRRLVDPFGGRFDLARRRIRFLHPASPFDDPTRALRAVRYANRLGFRIAPEARRRIAAAIAGGAFEAVSGERLRRELVLIFAEEGRAGAARRLHALGLDRAIAPALAQSAQGASGRVRAAEAFARREPSAATSWLCYLLAWMAPSTPREIRQVAERLSLAGKEREAALRWPEARRRLRSGLAALSPSRVRVRLAGLSADEIVAGAALLGWRDTCALLRALDPVGRARLSISGADLLARGVPRGSAIGRALAATLAAREDGRIAAEDELAFALRVARRRS
jgi:tRNA nucleotidyltransferase (CCA-adding enzyme)